MKLLRIDEDIWDTEALVRSFDPKWVPPVGQRYAQVHDPNGTVVDLFATL
jgi:hypothetical protein